MVTQPQPQTEVSDASFKTALEQSEQRIMIAIEDAKVSTIRWIVGSTVAISFVMIDCISGAVIWVAS